MPKITTGQADALNYGSFFPTIREHISYNLRMNSTEPTALTSAVCRLLRPLVRLLLRNGMAYADFTALVRRTYVEVAADHFELPGRKQSVSRVSVLTGINRKEVKRILSEPSDITPPENNRAARVISGWMRDNNTTDTDGRPLPLSWGDTNAKASFEALVKKYSGDMTARSVLDELRRVGAVVMEDNTVSLTANGYIPATSNEELLRLSSIGIADLVNTIDHNLSAENTATRLQLSVAYDDVPHDGVALFRNLSKEKSKELLQYLDSFLATQDRTVNPSVSGQGRYRTGLGIYYFEEALPNKAMNESGDEK